MVTRLIYLSSYVIWERSIVYLGWTLERKLACAQTGRIWFNTNEHDEPKQLSRSNCNAICYLRAVQWIELKLFKATTIEVAYTKRAMSKRWNGSQVQCTTHSSLWADLGTIMMDGIVDLRSGSAKLDFVNSTSNPDVIKPGKIVATAIEVDSVKMLGSAESVFSCVKRGGWLSVSLHRVRRSDTFWRKRVQSWYRYNWASLSKTSGNTEGKRYDAQVCPWIVHQG